MVVFVSSSDDATGGWRLFRRTTKKRMNPAMSSSATAPPTTGPATQARDDEPGLGVTAGLVVPGDETAPGAVAVVGFAPEGLAGEGATTRAESMEKDCSTRPPESLVLLRKQFWKPWPWKPSWDTPRQILAPP